MISGTTVIVGGYRDGGNGTRSGSGAAYLFDSTDGSQIAELPADDGEVSDYFGRSAGSSTAARQRAA